MEEGIKLLHKLIGLEFEKKGVTAGYDRGRARAVILNCRIRSKEKVFEILNSQSQNTRSDGARIACLEEKSNRAGV
jgi:hypothetical protein